MAQKGKLLRFFMKKRQLKLNPTGVIALVFLGIILLGTILLNLPVASRDGQSAGLLTSLFTATSSTCVTGLVLRDTWAGWSGFGQVVILCLIEIGGLGFMTAAAVVIFLFRRKVGLRQRMVIAQALSLNDMADVVKLEKWVLFGSLSVQLLGATVLTLHFLPDYGFRRSIIWGVFHSVSAFCNAGFDLFGSVQPGSSLICFNNDPVVLITLMALITFGGLGFFVWEEVARVRSFRKFSVYTKLVLVTTACLITVGAGVILLLEWNNPATFGPMPWGQKILNAFFQSVTLRTAGFVAVDQGSLSDGGKGFSMMLMLIGGSSGSTAGGLKTVTFLVILMFLWARARGKSSVSVYHRTIPGEKVMDAMTIAGVMILLAVFGATFLCATSPVGFTDAMYESVSALATVGLTAGITTSLSAASQILIILFMYFGRIGMLTISMGFLMGDRATERFRYAKTNLLIG